MKVVALWLLAACSSSTTPKAPVAQAGRAADHTRVFAVHFPFPGVGRVVTAAQGLVWTPEAP